MGSDHVYDVQYTTELFIVSPKFLFLYRELIKYEHSKCCKFYLMWLAEYYGDKCYDINTNFITNYLWLSMQKL